MTDNQVQVLADSWGVHTRSSSRPPLPRWPHGSPRHVSPEGGEVWKRGSNAPLPAPPASEKGRTLWIDYILSWSTSMVTATNGVGPKSAFAKLHISMKKPKNNKAYGTPRPCAPWSS